ncbi:hypothetical protein SALBM135S_00299 [Streptomyces alboniger]
MGAASGTTTLLRTLGGSLGVAVLGSSTGRMTDTLTDRLGEDGGASRGVTDRRGAVPGVEGRREVAERGAAAGYAALAVAPPAPSRRPPR